MKPKQPNERVEEVEDVVRWQEEGTREVEQETQVVAEDLQDILKKYEPKTESSPREYGPKVEDCDQHRTKVKEKDVSGAYSLTQ